MRDPLPISSTRLRHDRPNQQSQISITGRWPGRTAARTHATLGHERLIISYQKTDDDAHGERSGKKVAGNVHRRVAIQPKDIAGLALSCQGLPGMTENENP